LHLAAIRDSRERRIFYPVPDNEKILALLRRSSSTRVSRTETSGTILIIGYNDRRIRTVSLSEAPRAALRAITRSDVIAASRICRRRMISPRDWRSSRGKYTADRSNMEYARNLERMIDRGTVLAENSSHLTSHRSNVPRTARATR